MQQIQKPHSAGWNFKQVKKSNYIIGLILLVLALWLVRYVYVNYGPTSDHAANQFLAALQHQDWDRQYRLLDQSPTTLQPNGTPYIPGHIAPPAEERITQFFSRYGAAIIPKDLRLHIIKVDRTLWFGRQHLFIVRADGSSPKAAHAKLPTEFAMTVNRTPNGWRVDGFTTYDSLLSRVYGGHSVITRQFEQFWPAPWIHNPF